MKRLHAMSGSPPFERGDDRASRPSRLIALAAFGVAGLFCTGHASADEGPILVAERASINAVYLDPFKAWFDFNYFRDAETQKTNGVTTRFSEDQFQEIFTLKTTGYILHPNLVELNLQGSFGLEQDLINDDGKSGTENGTFYGWDLDATLFRKGDMPVTVYSRRTNSDYSQPFGPTLQQTLETDGIVFDSHNKTLPARVEYYHLSEDEKALDGSQNYQESDDVVTWQSRYEPTKQNRSALDYTFSSGSTTDSAAGFGGQNGNHFTDNNVSLNNELDFGPQALDHLQSSLTYLNEAGTFQLSDLRYNEALYLQHTDRFTTTFSYLLDDQSIGSGFGGAATDVFLQRGDAQFTHHLFKSLITSGDLAIQSLNLQPSGGQTDYSANLNFSYNKLVPLGRLAASLGIGYDQADNSASGQVTHIVNQQRSFNGSLPLIVTGNNIIADSLIVTDSTGVRIYRPGLDYLVRYFSDYLELERIPGGNIQDGQAVLLSYDLGAIPASTIRTQTFGLGGRYDFDTGPLHGLGVYVQYTDVDQSVSSTVAESYIPASLVDKTIGADYRVWELKFLAEQDWHHSAIAPYNQFRADARWVHPISDHASFTLDSSYLTSQYVQTNDLLTDFTIEASAEYRISRELSVNGSIQWLDQTDRLFGANRGLEEQLQVQWAHRNTTAYLQFRNSSFRYDIQSNQIQTIQVGIRRTF